MHESALTSSQYSGAIRRYWLMIVSIVALTVAVATAYSLTAPKKYESEANILVTPYEDVDNSFVGIDLLRDRATSVYTAGRLITTPQVIDTANARLGLRLDREGLLALVRVTPLQQSNLVSIVAKTDSPEDAARIANALADTLIAYRTASFQRQVRAAIGQAQRGLVESRARNPSEVAVLEGRLATLRGVVGAGDPTLDIFSRAVPDAKPVSPNAKLNIIVGLFAGVLLAAIATLIRQLLDTRLRDDEALDRLPILASIPRAPERHVRRYLRGRGSLPPGVWEAYRTLRTSLAGLGLSDETPRTILVTSAIQGEGKTMTAANLALTLAAGGTRVVLVDGDFRRPMIASVFGIDPPAEGFATLLQGAGSVEDALVPAPGYASLRLLLGGSERPFDLLEARRVEDVLAKLKREADVVIVDSPPATEFADAYALADAVDVVLVAIRLGHSREDEFNQLQRFLTQHQIKPAGFVVTSRVRSGGGRRATVRGDGARVEDRDAVNPTAHADGARAPVR